MGFLIKEFDDIGVGFSDFLSMSQNSRIGLQAGGEAPDCDLLFGRNHARQRNFPTRTADRERMSPFEKLDTQAIDAANFYRDIDFNVLTCTLSLRVHTGTHLN